MPTRSVLIPVVVLFGLFALLLAGCNEDKIEKALGGEVSRAIESTYRPVDDPALQDWISYVGHTTVGMSTRQHIPYDFTVLDSDTVNAMAAPWGHVYFMRGLLDFAEDEDEVWVVMGHEVGHVVHRDVIKAVKRTFLWNLGLAAVSTKSRGVAEALGVGLGLLSFHYSRGDEYDADRAGVIHTYRAGHDPRAGVAFFTRLMEKYEKHKPSKLEALLRTHPLTSARIEAIKRRPECDPENAEALAWIGQGYALRGRQVEGMKLLQQAVKINPKLAEARLALAEAAERRGYLALAREQLQACADVLGYVPSVERRVRIVEATQPQQWPEYSPQERQKVSLAASTVMTKRTSLLRGKTSLRRTQQSFAAQVKPLSAAANKVASKLSSLAQTDTELTDRLQTLLVKGNAAITQASDLVAGLEGVSDEVGRIGQATAEATHYFDRVSLLKGPAGPPGAAGWLTRSARELVAAQQDAAQATSLARTAFGPVRKALQSSQDAAVYMEKLVMVGENDLLMDSLRASSQRIEAAAAPARTALAKAKKTAARAEARVAVAKINLAAAGATPEELRAMADIIAYYARVPSERVEALLKKGAGLGEAAACLLASKACHRSPEALLAAGGASTVMDALQSAGASVEGAQILLKFVARAVSKELPTGGHEAPKFTS